MESSTINNNNLLPSQAKKNIKLIQINPSVCFATTNSTSTINKINQSTNSNGSVFVPVIDISGKKYLPVYLKQSLDDNNNQTDLINQSDEMSCRSTNMISQIVPDSQIVPSTIIEENEVENQSVPPPPLPEPDLNVERISMSQNDSVGKKSGINNKPYIKVPSHILIRRTPEGQKNLRAKTVRIGKIRWPPPLNSEEIDNANQQRQILVQRRIQEEIHRNEKILQYPPISHDRMRPFIKDIRKNGGEWSDIPGRLL